MELTKPATKENFISEVANRSKTKFQNDFEMHKKEHLFRFAIFLIPIFGMSYKAYEVLLTPSRIKEISDAPYPQDEIDARVHNLVTELQVSDLFFGIASLVEVVASVALGVVSFYLIPFFVFGVVVKTSLLMMNKEGLKDGFHEISKKKISLPHVRVSRSDGDLTRSDFIKLAIYSVLYCVPYLGVTLKRNQSLSLRAEYIHKDLSQRRALHIEKIQGVHDNCFFVAKVISLSIIMALAGLAISHPLFLLILSVSVVALSYFSGKVDLEEVFVGEIRDWRHAKMIIQQTS